HSASRTHTQLARPFSISSVWIRDVKGEMESAVRIFAVDDVLAFGRFLVAYFNLRANRITTERDFVTFQDLAATHQRQCLRRFHDHDAVGLFRRRGSTEHDCHSENS